MTVSAFSQIKYEKGYFITNVGERNEVFIKNVGWKLYPESFQYRASETGDVESVSITKVKEFGFDGGLKYIRETVPVTQSSDGLQTLNQTRDPSYITEQVFLKVLVEGKASLYHYANKDATTFYVRMDDGEIKPLEYREYITNTNRVAENNRYKQQLLNALNCESITLKDIERLKYTQSSLRSIFESYNKCSTVDYQSYKSKGAQDLFGISIRPRVGFRSFNVELKNSFQQDNVEFDTELSYGLGVELEHKLAFNNGAWAILVEPTFQYYKAEKDNGSQVITTDYQSIELPFGVRHYIFLGDLSQLFLNVSYVVDLPLNARYERYGGASFFDIDSSNNLAFGAGYRYNDKIALELRYSTNRDLLNQFERYNTKYSGLSFVFGYSLF